MELEQAKQIVAEISKLTEEQIKKNFQVNEIGLALDVCFANRESQLIENSIDKAISIYPLNGRIIIIKALLLAKAQRSQDAISLLSLCPNEDEQFLSCVDLIGVIFMNNHQFERGIQTFTALLTQIDSDKHAAYIYNQRAICNQYLGDYLQALNDCIKAAEKNSLVDSFFSELNLNFRLCLSNGLIHEAIEKMKQFETFCLQSIEEYYVYGPFIFLIEMSYYRKDILRVNELFDDYKESELDDIEEMSIRVEEIKDYLKLIKEYDESEIDQKKRNSLKRKLKSLNEEDFKVFQLLPSDF
ncbi:MAG: tetratricopeptide repeat protein [Crocinitomicaceae bacterium]